jgi:hypothetical protein
VAHLGSGGCGLDDGDVRCLVGGWVVRQAVGEHGEMSEAGREEACRRRRCACGEGDWLPTWKPARASGLA